MALHLINPQYRIDRASMRDLAFAPATERLNWPTAVSTCWTKRLLPASAAQIWAFRLEADTADHANEYFATSTAALYFRADGAYHVAIYDTQRKDGTDNLLITDAYEGYDAHQKTGRWRVSMKDHTLTAMLKHAEMRDRIMTPGTRNLPLDGAYAMDTRTIALLGDKSLATDVQTWLRNNGYTTGHNWFLSYDDLDKLDVNDQYAELRRVGVCGDGIINNMLHLYASDRCNDFGRARGVRNTSTGEKGGR